MVGYALTCTGDSTSPGDRLPKSQIKALYQAVKESPKPVVVVCQNVGPDRLRSNMFGDVMATTFQRLGAVGAVTDGGIRDVAGIRQRAPGFQMFAPGAVASGGIFAIVDIGLTVSVCGLTIAPGDLLHGDANGVVTIPHVVADKVAAKGQEVLAYELKKVDFIKSPEFTLEGLERMSGHLPVDPLRGKALTR
jgi:regulator of RNase E activity RraA